MTESLNSVSRRPTVIVSNGGPSVVDHTEMKPNKGMEPTALHAAAHAWR